jgi:hypothetical protein
MRQVGVCSQVGFQGCKSEPASHDLTYTLQSGYCTVHLATSLTGATHLRQPILAETPIGQGPFTEFPDFLSQQYVGTL